MARIGFAPRLAALTTGATLALVSLGVYTAATGSGLACSAQWPLCSGGVLPRTLPSFIEWLHRLVAMLTGFLILGTAAAAWRAPDVDRRSTLAATAAAALLPLQVGIGAVTVTLSGLLPGGYSPPVHAAHLLVALSIFTLLAAVTVRSTTSPTVPAGRVRRALLGGLAAVAVATPFGRVVAAVPYTPGAQATFVAASLTGYVALLAAGRWLDGVDRALVGVAAAGVVLALLLGRDLLPYTPAVRAGNAAVVLVTVAAVAVVTYRLRGRRSAATADRVVGD